MKKIIAAFDGLKYSESTEKYALEAAKKYNDKIYGVFLDDFTYHSYKITDMLGGDDVDTLKAEYLRKFDVDTRENAVRLFTERCVEAGISYGMHRDRNIAIQELIHESLFADLIIIQNNETLTHYSEQAPSNFISDLLERAHCPVLAVPPLYKKPEKIIFLYDGEPSSIFAIKQFGYLFPGQQLKTEMLIVKKNEQDQSMPDNQLLKEWVKLNYPDTIFSVLPGDPREEIENYVNSMTENSILVLGAYGRGSFSRMVHKSLADTLIRKIDNPLFIAHK